MMAMISNTSSALITTHSTTTTAATSTTIVTSPGTINNNNNNNSNHNLPPLQSFFQFNSVLEHNGCRQAFRAYLKQVHSEEQLDFLSMVSQLRAETSRDAQCKLAKQIISQFVVCGSTQEINVEQSLRDRCVDAVNSISMNNENVVADSYYNAFKELERQIIFQLKTDMYDKFLTGPIFEQFLAKEAIERLSMTGTSNNNNRNDQFNDVLRRTEDLKKRKSSFSGMFLSIGKKNVDNEKRTSVDMEKIIKEKESLILMLQQSVLKCNDHISRLEKQVKQLEDREHALRATNEEQLKQISSLREDVDNISIDFKSMKERKDGLEVQCKLLQEQITSKDDLVNNKQIKLDEVSDQLATICQELTLTKASVSMYLEQLELLESQVNQLKMDITNREIKIQTLNDEVNNLQEMNSYKDLQLAALTQELDFRTQKINNLENDIKNLEMDLSSKTLLITEMVDTVVKLEAETSLANVSINAYLEQFKSMELQLNRLKLDIENRDEMIENLKNEISDTITNCNSKELQLTHLTEELVIRDQKIVALEKDIKILENENSIKNLQIIEMKDTITKLEAEKSLINTTANMHLEQLSLMRLQINQLTFDIENRDKIIQNLNVEVDNSVANINVKEQELVDIKQQLEVRDEYIATLESNVKNLEADISSKILQITTLTDTITKLEAENSPSALKTTDLVQSMDSSEKRIEELKQKIEELEFNLLLKTQSELALQSALKEMESTENLKSTLPSSTTSKKESTLSELHLTVLEQILLLILLAVAIIFMIVI
jgi:chromosome segregation ATPase